MCYRYLYIHFHQFSKVQTETPFWFHALVFLRFSVVGRVFQPGFAWIAGVRAPWLVPHGSSTCDFGKGIVQQSRSDRGAERTEEVRVPLSHPLTGWDESHHPFIGNIWHTWSVWVCVLILVSVFSQSFSCGTRTAVTLYRGDHKRTWNGNSHKGDTTEKNE